MAILVTDPCLEERLRTEREASGADRYDEVWEGVYMMAPMPTDEHQKIVSRLGHVVEDVLGDAELAEIRPGVNLSDREDDWKYDYRVPDVDGVMPHRRTTTVLRRVVKRGLAIILTAAVGAIRPFKIAVTRLLVIPIQPRAAAGR